MFRGKVRSLEHNLRFADYLFTEPQISEDAYPEKNRDSLTMPESVFDRSRQSERINRSISGFSNPIHISDDEEYFDDVSLLHPNMEVPSTERPGFHRSQFGDSFHFSDSRRSTRFSETYERKTSGLKNGSVKFAMKTSFSSTIFLSDKNRQLDFVLAYQSQPNREKPSVFHRMKSMVNPKFNPQLKSSQFEKYRQEFEENLQEMGLELEYEGVELSQDGKTCFVKIHAPYDVLAKTAEFNRVKMPLRPVDLPKMRSESLVDRFFTKIFGKNPFEIEEELQIWEPEYFHAVFSRNRECQFIMQDHSTFFQPTQRIRMVWDMLLSARIKVSNPQFDKGVADAGIKWLLKENVYKAAYAVHDGDAKSIRQAMRGRRGRFEYEDIPPKDWPLRMWLAETWARFGRWYQYQPLNQIRNYYGEKVGLYFAWLGFYTSMLILPSIVGSLCVLYGVLTYATSASQLAVCNFDEKTQICRACAQAQCPFRLLKDSCAYARLTYIFDNSSTVFFAFFMSIWAVVFLEMWKRYQAELCWDWDLRDFEVEEESIRPEFQAAVKTIRKNPITGNKEPYLSPGSQIHRFLLSSVTVACMLFAVVGILSGIIVYKRVARGHYFNQKSRVTGIIPADILSSITGAGLNSICILLAGSCYTLLAKWLTTKELPRTDSEFETSYTYKMFIFQFVNFYSALFYIAFFKGES